MGGAAGARGGGDGERLDVDRVGEGLVDGAEAQAGLARADDRFDAQARVDDGIAGRDAREADAEARGGGHDEVGGTEGADLGAGGGVEVEGGVAGQSRGALGEAEEGVTRDAAKGVVGVAGVEAALGEETMRREVAAQHLVEQDAQREGAAIAGPVATWGGHGESLVRQARRRRGPLRRALRVESERIPSKVVREGA